MKILVVGDLHGVKPKIHFKDFDCIVQVGDVCDDSNIAPLYKRYFEILKEDSAFIFGADEFFISEVGKRNLKQYEKDSLKKGHEVLKYLDSFGKPVFMVGGNWDQSYGPSMIKDLNESDYNYRKAFYDWYLGDKLNPKLTKDLKNIKDCMYRNHVFNQINFVGYGLSSGPELSEKLKKLDISKKQFKKLKKSIKKIFNKLLSAYQKRDKKFPVIFISHNIPYKTKLDVVKDKESYAYRKHLGSSIAREFCQRHQPLICIGGHVHEGKGKDKIGKTILINPGFGKDAQVLIDLDEIKGEVRKIKFCKGYKKAR